MRVVTRLLDDKYVAWLAGYYDDFIGTKCIVDDKNNPDNEYSDHTLTHHGNTCNGEAPLNPHYRYSVIERQSDKLLNAGSSALSAAFPVTTWSGIRSNTGLLSNAGLHEYITLDITRLNKGQGWEGKATSRNPQSFYHQNRSNTGVTGAGVTTDGYMWTNNPRRTGAKYWYICDDDGSEGRKDMKDYTATQDSGANKHWDALSHLSLAQTGIRRHSYMTGLLQWQSMNDNVSHLTKRLGIGTTIQSLGGKPFMVLDTKWWRNGSNTFSSLGAQLLMQYEGTLNALGDKDRFHIRVARQAFVGGGASYGGAPDTHDAKEPQFKLQVGFDNSVSTFGVTGVKITSSGAVSTPAITIQKQYSDLIQPMSGAHFKINAVPAEYVMVAPVPGNDQASENFEEYGAALWADVDIECDFTNQSYQLFINGVVSGNPTSFGTKPSGGNWSPSDFYGWNLSGVPVDYADGEWSGNTQGWQQLICIDRVSFGKNITNHIGKTASAGGGNPAIATGHTDYPSGHPGDPMIEEVNMSMTANGTSTTTVQLIDDMNNLNIYPLITGGSNAEYLFLLFRNGDNRPIITRNLDDVSVKQYVKTDKRVITLRMSDPAKLLDRQLPSWDMGQLTFTSDIDKSVGRRSDAEHLNTSLFFGSAVLKVCDDSIGFEYDSTSLLTYREQKDQRTTLNTAHPIQMYNNEDVLGPNNIENEWLGKRCRVIAPIKSDDNGDGTYAISTAKTAYYFTSPDLEIDDTINVFGSASNDVTNRAITQEAVHSIGNLIVTTQTPPTHTATVSDVYRYANAAGTSYVAAILDSGSFSVISNDLSFTNITFLTSKTNGLSANIDNYAYKIMSVGTTLNNGVTTYTIFTDMAWSVVNSTATHTGYLTLGDDWKAYWDTGYVDLHTADASSVFNNTTPWNQVENRVAHAVWMRDLPKSLWFKKMFGRIKKDPLYASTIHTNNIAPAAASVITSITYASTSAKNVIIAAAEASGVAEIIYPTGKADIFCFSGAAGSSPGKIVLNGCKFITMPHLVGATINILDISDDFKHIWVLWADMRNNGEADACGGLRKNKFGLTYPTPDNYGVSLHYTDQTDIDGQSSNFVDLSVGLDCDIWEVDSETEPFTGNSWSSLGSDSSVHTQFRNWEDKAGAFLIFDFSKFFNLNTEVNGGKSGQLTGGRKSLGDLVVDTEGHPALIDDYWQEATASPKTTGAAIDDHPNWYHYFSAGSNLAANSGSSPYNNIVSGATSVTLETTAEFPNEGFGMLELERESAATNGLERNLMFYFWNGNNTSTNVLSNVSIIEIDETLYTTEQIRNDMVSLWRTYTQAGVSAFGSPQPIRYNNSILNITDGYDKIVFYSGLAAPLSLRFMMVVKGFVESKNSNTHSLSDKLRAISVLASSDTHLSQFTMPINFGLNNMPITERMTNTQLAVSASTKKYDLSSGSTQDWDNYGNVLDARGKTILGIISEASNATRLGENDTTTIFTYTTGRDGMLDIRPAYSSGFIFTRDNLRLSDITGSPTAAVSNVRVYYNSGASFVDYPSAVTGGETRWKTIDLPSVRSNNEAMAIAKSTYDKSKESSFSITCEVVQQLSETNQMLYNARYGYILDPAYRTVQAIRYGTGTALGWSSWFNGSLQSGMTNALDGNVTYTGAGNAYTYANGGGGGMMGSPNTGDLDPEDSYTWVGCNSISEAVQIVHIPKGMPKSSDSATDQQLRIGIILADSYNSSVAIDDVEYYLVIYDPNTTYTTSGDGTVINDNIFSKTTLKFRHNGFHEIAIPATYWTGQTGAERIVVSLNSDYLRALLRQRNGNPSSGWYYANAHDISGMNTTNGGGEVRAYSPFPLGYRTMAGISTAQDAPIYHAPRISVVDDINFYPSTKITYTDASVGISTATAFSVKAVQWTAKTQDVDKVVLTLERDESKSLGGLASYLLPEVSKGRTPGTADTGQGGVGGGGGNSGGGDGYAPPLVWPPNGNGKVGDTEGGEANPGWGLPRNFEGVGIGGGSEGISGQHFSNQTVGVNNTTPDLMKRIKGNMDMHNQFGLQDGDFSILGSKKTGATPQMLKGLEGVGAVWDKRKGAIFSKEGAVLPGITSSEPTSVGANHQHSLSVSVPSDVMGRKVVLSGIVSCGGEATESALLSITLECVETGSSNSISIPVFNNSQNNTQTLMTTELDGADVVGNTIKATIKRQANTGTDNARYTSVVLHEMDIKFVRSAGAGRSDSYRFLGFKSGGIRNL